MTHKQEIHANTKQCHECQCNLNVALDVFKASPAVICRAKVTVLES